jgi:hypothetical protein
MMTSWHHLVCSSSLSLPAGQISKKVTVPHQLVGLIVGPKGATIKRIQQNTHTYILTPSRDSQPVFEIQGAPENIEKARVEIENYVKVRMGFVSPFKLSEHSFGGGDSIWNADAKSEGKESNSSSLSLSEQSDFLVNSLANFSLNMTEEYLPF